MLDSQVEKKFDKQLSVVIPSELDVKIEEIAQSRYLYKSDIVREAIIDIIRKYEKGNHNESNHRA